MLLGVSWVKCNSTSGASVCFGTKRTSRRERSMFALRGKVDISLYPHGVRRLYEYRECLVDFLCRGSSKDNDLKSASASRLANIF